MDASNIPMPFMDEQAPVFSLDHLATYVFQSGGMRGTRPSRSGLDGILKALLKNSYNMPLRKMDSKCAFSEIHISNNRWCKERDKAILPRFLYHCLGALQAVQVLQASPIIREYCNDMRRAVQLKMTPETEWSEDDRTHYQMHKSVMNELFSTVILMALKNGDRYRIR